jgi:hypothetical protein
MLGLGLGLGLSLTTFSVADDYCDIDLKINRHTAAKAMDVLNFTPLNNKPIRIMYSHRDPSVRKSGAANIFIKVLIVGISLVYCQFAP